LESNDEFRQYILVAEALLEQATPDQLVDALKLLAINFGYLTQRHGDGRKSVYRDFSSNQGR